MNATLATLARFREQSYKAITHQANTFIELLDSLCLTGSNCSSLAQLTEAMTFLRHYSMANKCIKAFTAKDFLRIQKIAIQLLSIPKDPWVRLAIDTTPEPRPYAHTLKRRSFIHSSTPTPGQKPIAIGHVYSVTSVVIHGKHCPLAIDRVDKEESGTQVGVKQVQAIAKHFGDQRLLAVGDTAYSSLDARHQMSAVPSITFITRLRSNRGLHCPVDAVTEKKRGRPRIYGAKFSFKDPETHGPADAAESFEHTSYNGQVRTVQVRTWNRLISRGTKDHDGASLPMRVACVEVMDAEGNHLYSRPLWLGIHGQHAQELTPQECALFYFERFGIEHLFRMAKQNLLFNDYHSPDVDDCEAWHRLCVVAMMQLTLGIGTVKRRVKPWEKYNREFKRESLCQSMRDVQRVFADVLHEVGTPAKPPVPRGKGKGRCLGQTQTPRVKCPVERKPKKKDDTGTKELSGELESEGKSAIAEKMAKKVLTLAKNNGVTPEEVIEAFKKFNEAA